MITLKLDPKKITIKEYNKLPEKEQVFYELIFKKKKVKRTNICNCCETRLGEDWFSLEDYGKPLRAKRMICIKYNWGIRENGCKYNMRIMY